MFDDPKFVAVVRSVFGEGVGMGVGFCIFSIRGHRNLVTEKQAARYYMTVIDYTCELLAVVHFEKWLGQIKQERVLST